MKCGRCGSETVQRVNRASGIEFTGCSQWPKCTWSFNPPRREIVGSREAMNALEEEDPDGHAMAGLDDYGSYEQW